MEKTRTNLFHRTNEKLSDRRKRILTLSSIAVLVFGLIWILYPFFDGASEIFIPGWSGAIELGIFVAATALIVVIFHILCFTVASFRRQSAKYLIYMLLPIGLLIGLHCLVYPWGLSRSYRRVASFPLGAKISVMRAGGASKIRQEALAFLATASETSPARSPWPESLRALGACAVRVDKNAQLVDVEIPKRRWFFWGDQFGYLITDKGAKEPVIVHDPPLVYGHRLWKIADGIYLYEKW